MIKLLQKNKKINVKEFRGYWRDIGRPEDFELANKEFSKYKKKLINEKNINNRFKRFCWKTFNK